MHTLPVVPFDIGVGPRITDNRLKDISLRLYTIS